MLAALAVIAGPAIAPCDSASASSTPAKVPPPRGPDGKVRMIGSLNSFGIDVRLPTMFDSPPRPENTGRGGPFRPDCPAPNAAPRSVPFEIVSVSPAIIASTPARIWPATSGAKVGLSVAIPSAVTEPVSSPLRAAMSKRSDCSANASCRSVTSLVAMLGSVAPTSSFGAFESPLA